MACWCQGLRDASDRWKFRAYSAGLSGPILLVRYCLNHQCKQTVHFFVDLVGLYACKYGVFHRPVGQVSHNAGSEEG